MKRALGILVGLALALAQYTPTYCGREATAIPVLKRFPSLTGGISPTMLSTPGSMTFAVSMDWGEGVVWDYTPSPWVEVEWRWDRFNLPGYPPNSSVYYRFERKDYPTYNSTTWTLSYPVSLEAQGIYRLRASASFCYKACDKCTPVQQYLNVDTYAAAFMFGNDTGSGATLSRLLWLLDEESKRSGDTLEVFMISNGIDPSLRSMLTTTATGGFYNCNFFNICAVRKPAKVQRFLTDNPGALRSLVATGCLVGGLLPTCQGNQDSRVYDIGPKVSDFGVLIINGMKHTYIAFGPGLVNSQYSFFLVEGPKGMGEMLRQALLFQAVQSQAKEVR